MTTFRIAALAAGLAMATSAPALAQGLSFSGGVTITSDYMSRGVTNSRNRPALQFYGEVEASGFYAGLWGSTVDFGLDDPDDLEIDLYAGYRFSVGAASFDIGYARYFYDSSGNCCGELYGLASYETGPLNLFAGVYVDPSDSFRVNDVHAGFTYSFAERWSAGLKAGRAGRPSWTYGIASVGYQLNDNVSFEAAYHMTRAAGERNRFVVSASVSF